MRNFLVLVIAGFCNFLWADIYLLWNNGARAVIYESVNGRVLYRPCDADSGTFDRTCPSIAESSYSMRHFCTRLARLFKIPSRFQGPEGLTRVVRELEELKRADVEEPPQLVSIRDKLLGIHEKFLSKLTQENDIYLAEAKGEDFHFAFYALQEVWFDDKTSSGKVWWLASSAGTFLDQFKLCRGFWSLATLGDYYPKYHVYEAIGPAFFFPEPSAFGPQVRRGQFAWAKVSRTGERHDKAFAPRLGVKLEASKHFNGQIYDLHHVETLLPIFCWR